MIGRTVSHYRIVEKLGEGGMGVVYRAEDVRLRRPVALKFLQPHMVADHRARERFRKEAQAASALDHPNVCVIHEIDETDRGEFFIAMPYYAGETLREKLERGPLRVGEAIDIACQVAHGLSRAHTLGIIHRDIKPDNLKATEDGIWKILDFGIAKLAGATRVTRTGGAMGTVAYMSPEQAGSEEATQQSDIWSLGVVLYEMLTGRVPFRGATPVATLYQILHEEPAPLRDARVDVPPVLDRVVTRALAKDLRARYGSISELLADLERVPDAAHARARSRRSVAEYETTSETQVATVPPFLTPTSEPSDEAVLPPFVGRKAQLDVLDSWLRDAAAGRGRVGFATGEAGTGKTAMTREFWRAAMERASDLVVAVGACNAHTGIGDPYHPFREILALLTGDVEAQWAGGSLSADHATRLWSLLPLTLDALVRSGPDLVGTFVSETALVARGEEHPALRGDGLVGLRRLSDRRASAQSIQQADLFEQYVRVLRSLAKEKPLLLVVDDLQWADAGSIGLLFHLGRQLKGSRILVLGLYRPSEVALGRGGERHPLEPVLNELRALFGPMEVGLDQAAGQEFTDALIDSEPNRLATAFREALFRQTQGHALFTVELLRALKDRGMLVHEELHGWCEAPGLEWAVLPARIDAVLEERIGRLAPELQQGLAVAAVEGERFTLEAVADVLGQDVAPLIFLFSRELEKRHRLVQVEGVRQVDGRRLSLYRFRHILFQRHLYDGLSAAERSQLHEKVGEALERLHGERTAEIALGLARHFREAGLADKTASYLHLAGQQAMGATAFPEAVADFESALEALLTLPASTDRDRRELELQLELGNARNMSAVPGQLDAFERANELAEKVGSDRQLCRALAGLYLAWVWGGDYRRSSEAAQRCLALALKEDDPVLIGPALDAVGRTSYFRGEFHNAATAYKELLSRYDPDLHVDPRYLASIDVSSLARGMLSWPLWQLGYPDQALAWSREALKYARARAHPGSLSFVLLYVMWTHQYRRDVPASEEAREQLLQAAADAGLIAQWEPVARVCQGWAQAQRGNASEGIELIRTGWNDLASKGFKYGSTYWAALLADAHRLDGRAKEALALLEGDRWAAGTVDELLYVSLIQRIRGELFLALPHPDPDRAEAAFRQAIDTARSQEAKCYELQATTRLAHLLHSQGRTAEARDMLGTIYGWFTEGFDTADLVEAKALLTELEQAESGTASRSR